MYIRRKVFSLLEVEGEERLFSTTDINLEDPEYKLFSINDDYQEIEQREFSNEEKDNKKDKIGKNLKTAGKAGMAVGGTAALASGIAENIIADKIAKNAANMYGVEKIGKGLSSVFIGRKSKKATEVTERALKNSKIFRGLGKADNIGLGLALAGLGTYAAGKATSKKKENNKKK